MLELSLHILDIAENSTRSGARTILVEIKEDPLANLLTLKISDDGAGMAEDTLKRVADPFFTTKTVRKVGLGLPLLKQAAEAAGGGMSVSSEMGKGTTVAASFMLDHLDRQPLGDMGQTMVTLVAGSPETNFIYRHLRNGGQYVIDTGEIKKELGNIPINNAQVLGLIRSDIEEGLREIGAIG